MSSQRPGRVQEAIRQEASKIIQYEMNDPRIGFITITKVELTKDLRYARIYFTVLGDDKAKHLALKGLTSAKGYVKGLIADRIKLRFMPEIVFKVDESFEHTKRIYDLLDKLKNPSAGSGFHPEQGRGMKKEKTDEGSDRGDKDA